MEETKIVNGKYQGVRGARITPRWDPKNWKPIYESIIALSCTGLSNTVVAERFGVTPQTVSNLRSSEKGKKLISLIAARVRDMNNESIGERVAALQSKALERVETVIMSDEAFAERPLAIFDRSLQVLKSGILKEERPANGMPQIGNINKAVFMSVSPEGAKQLNDGLNKADQVKVIHSGDTGTVKP